MKEVLLNKKDSSVPFVWKKNDEYFIEGVKYTDDIELLMSAIDDVQALEFDDLEDSNEVANNKEDYWKALFNYQWSEGGLVLWHNPTEMWEQELTRRGEAFCKCGTKKFMHYKSWCPACDIPQPDKKGAVDLIHLCNCIEHQHKLQDRQLWAWITDNFEFHNDSYISLDGWHIYEYDYDDIQYYYYDKTLGESYLKMINDVYPIDKHLFLVSW